MTAPPCRCLPFTDPCAGVCGITDAFDRAVVGGLGTATCGLTYDPGVAGYADWDVAAGVATAVGNNSIALLAFIATGRMVANIYLTAQVLASGAPTSGDVFFLGADTAPDYAEIDFATDGTLYLSTYSNIDSVSMPFGPDQQFKMRLNAGGANARCKVWLAPDPEPSGWTLEVPFDAPTTAFDQDLYYGMNGGSSMTIEVTSVDAPGLTRCTTMNPVLDDFNRYETGELGTASSGPTWDTVDPRVAVNGTQAVIVTDTADNAYVEGHLTLATPLAALPIDLYVGFTIDKDLSTPPTPGTNEPYSINAIRVRLGNAATGDYYEAELSTDRWDDGSNPHTTVQASMRQIGSASDNIAAAVTDALDFAGEPLVLHFHIDGVNTYAEIASLGLNSVVLSNAAAVPTLPLDTLQMGGVALLQPAGGTDYVPVTAMWDYIKINNCYQGGPLGARPILNQPVQDELVGYGDGTTTAFTTAYPYVAGSLQVDAAGILADVDNTDPATGSFTFTDPPPAGAAIRATYRGG